MCYTPRVIEDETSTMNIEYYGDFCFKITTKPNGRATEDVVIVTDVPEKATGLRAPQGEAQIVVLSHQERNIPELALIKGEPLVLVAPGEYSAKGVTLVGLPTFRDSEAGMVQGKNTVFLIESEEMRLCFLGALGHELDPGTIEKIGDVDILFIPAAGTDTLVFEKVDDLIRKIEPKVVIPMHYKLPGMKTDWPDAKKFCDAVGNCPEETLAKYNVKKKDLEGKVMEVVLLNND